MNHSVMRNCLSSRTLKWGLLVFLACITGYLAILMYLHEEYLFAALAILIVGTGLFIFANSKTYAWRYVYPGLAGMGLFILFPLFYTISIGFTNYSSDHQLTLERAENVLLDRQVVETKRYPFHLYSADKKWFIVLGPVDSQYWRSPPFQFGKSRLTLKMQTSSKLPAAKAANLRTIIKYRSQLNQLRLHIGDKSLAMNSLRAFAAMIPLYKTGDNQELINQQTGVHYRPNMKVGNYQQVLANGEWGKDVLTPGFTVNVGWYNFVRIVMDPGIRAPFIGIFFWTIIFAFLTVVFTVAIGMVLACLVQWEALRGRAIYRVFIILPYAVPAFISILIFKGLFNQSFGEINLLLGQLFGIQPEWFNNPLLAKIMVLIVNTWLGYPYMMILCMGLLKAIPDDLYEASAMDGANVIQNFFRITFPMLIKPLMPLMIASFAFNFNNFVLIQLLTNGGPDRLGTTTPAGYTDLLVSYTYRIAFEGSGGQDFGLAAAISTVIFLLVGALAVINLKASHIQFDQ
ncbi:maltose ABC transporter permease MalF [Celerinatantimonas diazotrophica]|uniref:Maltose/maltodextrin transport system permease protein n=1 Tax=Celerinatantimonas diazotrophica TaxID=412034 RepID=A0A4R1K1R7_9GAMM|nr:maltooligosaccharide ABC transporter membrane protein [Celerinatantimonas diazotrophica]CAG9298020.1 Maltose/maltodextrin transport system permease protein MalF [Celerinatantimonas diazotrophica]